MNEIGCECNLLFFSVSENEMWSKSSVLSIGLLMFLFVHLELMMKCQIYVNEFKSEDVK